jgi:hypothetical protein
VVQEWESEQQKWFQKPPEEKNNHFAKIFFEISSNKNPHDWISSTLWIRRLGFSSSSAQWEEKNIGLKLGG